MGSYIQSHTLYILTRGCETFSYDILWHGIVSTFLHPTYIHSYTLHMYILTPYIYTFLHFTYIHSYTLHIYILTPYIYTFLHPTYVHSYTLHHMYILTPYIYTRESVRQSHIMYFCMRSYVHSHTLHILTRGCETISYVLLHVIICTFSHPAHTYDGSKYDVRICSHTLHCPMFSHPTLAVDRYVMKMCI